MKMPKVVSLFSGAGGLDYGFEAAGCKIATTVEMDRDSCSTLRENTNSIVIEDDIFNVTSKQILEASGCHGQHPDILIGGPPCQPFSKSGFWRTGESGRLSDPRAATLDAYLRVLEDTLPHAMLLENVAGLGYSGKSEGLQLLLDRIGDINQRTGSNYNPKYGIVNASSYGVPQHRQRFFIVAGRDGESFDFPQITHSDDADGSDENGQEPIRTAYDALYDAVVDPQEDLSLRGKWADLIPSIPEGSNYLHHTERGEGLPLFGWRCRYWNFLLKLSKRLPSWTIQAQPGPSVGPFHWDNRRLSIDELCRLQTFPRKVKIVGARTSVQKQLGNAVPSLLAEVFAREILIQILGRSLNSTQPSLLPQRVQDVPPPKRVKAVPEKYLHLVGEHQPHPGTGMGPGVHRA